MSLLIKLSQIYTRYDVQISDEDPFQPQLIHIVDYIVNNFEQPLTLDSIADRCFISKSFLSHEFKRTMGVGVYRYITMHRLYRAHQMLLSGVKPKAVAQRCGFKDYSDFYRAFLKEYNCSPRVILNDPRL